MTDAFLTQYTNTPDNLIAGNKVVPMTEEITLLSGENRTRGTVLGKITKLLGTPVAGGGNVGDGTIGSVAMKAKTKIGNYVVTLMDATDFKVVDPDGHLLDWGAVGVAYANSEIGFTITAGATPFEKGDTFTIPVTAGSGKYKMSLAAAVDGSQNVCKVLSLDTDASAGDKVTAAYKRGEFNKSKLVLGTGHTLASIKDALEALDIYLADYVE